MKYPVSNPPRNQLIAPTIGLPLSLQLVHLAWQPFEFRVGKTTDGPSPSSLKNTFKPMKSARREEVSNQFEINFFYAPSTGSYLVVIVVTKESKYPEWFWRSLGYDTDQ